MLKALVITPNDKTKEYGDLIAIARAEARRREHSQNNPSILVIQYCPELKIYIAVYQACDNSNSMKDQKVK